MDRVGENKTGTANSSEIIKRQAAQIAGLKQLIVTLRDDVMLRDGNPLRYAHLLDEVERTLQKNEHGSGGQRRADTEM